MERTSSSLSVLDQAVKASGEGNSASALALFAEAAAAEPGSAMPHFLMGGEYAALGQIEQAEAHFANAVLLAPAFVVARYQLGLLQYTSGRPAIAMVTWQALLAIEEGPYAHWVRGFAALAQDDFDVARKMFEEGIACNTDNPPMSDDIRQMIAGIDRIQAAAPLSSEVPSDDVETESSHFLLSNYRQHGPAH